MLSGLPNVSLPYEFQNFTLLLLTLLRPANVAEEVVLHAFKTGYRHVSGQKMCIATYTESPLHRWIQPERIGTRGPVRMPSENAEYPERKSSSLLKSPNDRWAMNRPKLLSNLASSRPVWTILTCTSPPTYSGGSTI